MKMKAFNKLKYIGLACCLSFASCNEYLDINVNPNSPTYVQPDLILPGAINTAAAYQVSYSTYGGNVVGYIANAGGFSGFGNLLTYDYVAGTGSQWGAYDNLLDFKYVIDGSADNPELINYKAAAEVMSVYQFHKLVDQHNDIPYEEALQGKANYAPKYSEASSIYVDLLRRLNEAIGMFDGESQTVKKLNASSDPLFKGDIDQWKKFANTLKLRLLIRISAVDALKAKVTEEFAKMDMTLGFLTKDAINNPGYVKDRPNPTWSTWGYSTAGNPVPTSRVPSYYIYGYYDGNKIDDSWRGKVIYNDFGVTSRPTPLNQLGNETGNPPVRSGYSTWYTGVRSSASSITDALGVVKGPTQGQPMMLAAESYFLQAEAFLKGYLTGNMTTAFENGIKASFNYLYLDVNGALAAGKNVATDFAAYKAANAASYLVDISKAGTDAQKLEAIITQKYIAMNMITGEEAWNDYRRTGYPKTTPGGSKYVDMASVTSNSPRPDRLPTMIKYPTSEYNYNAANTKEINHFSDQIFWAKK